MGQVNQQNFTTVAVRSAAILTDTYVAGNVVGAKNAVVNSSSPTDICLEDYNQLVVLAKFTIGSLTSAQIKVEWSNDGTTYYQDSFLGLNAGTGTLSLGAYTIAATGNYMISVPIKARYAKISVKGTGTMTNSSMAIDATVGTI